MVRATKRYRLSKKEIKKLIKNIESSYPSFHVDKKSVIEYAKVGDIEFYIIDNIPVFFKYKENKLIPVLVYLIRKGYSWLPRVIIDRGATKAMGKGADLMIPGIRDLDEFGENTVVVIVDEESDIPVAVGLSILSSEEIRRKLANERRGRAIRNVHHPGDKVWKAATSL